MAENKKFIINKNVIEVELTLRCNLHCANCDRMAPKPLDIKLDDFKNFLALDRKWSSIRLIGGEPLLYPHIEEVFKILENYKDKCLIGLSTNGYNKELLKRVSVLPFSLIHCCIPFVLYLIIKFISEKPELNDSFIPAI